MKNYLDTISFLKQNQFTWLITGVAGFIGSNLLEVLLSSNQKVIGLDNFSTGFKKNLTLVKEQIPKNLWKNFVFIEGDIRSKEDCSTAIKGVDFVLHEAALGSVPRSIIDPITTNENNITGFLNLLDISRKSGVKRFVFAASSSTYGDSENLPKVEDIIGNPLSPYAVTKYVNELYAQVFAKTYGLDFIGLRYFNVFGKRQDPNGSYAAVIPKWIKLLLKQKQPVIFGNGQTSRDFCYIENVVQANILSAIAPSKDSVNQIYNIAYGQRTNLLDLYKSIKLIIETKKQIRIDIEPKFAPFRTGDVMHSHADITKAYKSLGYKPDFDLELGLKKTIESFIKEDARI